MLGAEIWYLSHNWFAWYVDVKLFGMTVHERYPNSIQTECSNCGESINKWAQFKEILLEKKKQEPGQFYHEELETSRSEEQAKQVPLIAQDEIG